ncbi:Tim44/TimA family putative adaptor protein [Sphingomonas prati]|uniref:Putative lipid-binding transport protein (Tim44 family) n=1 Tax=Sphingomonas prati TaxID=1843237 RepID=A0A7W9BTY2_9SPHN|nr:Tim44/TimA family putative adaptor protein [Sphingomonas prati]MBB5730063.1 putative lipid-binding transport protein (Tim44 family) [Sphingomonas prati]GGE91164.1 calcium-binding protein [Sphingomonas prati]
METIIILALVFFFVGLRLYSVLGKRTGHEQPIVKPVETKAATAALPRTVVDAKPEATTEPMIEPQAHNGLRALIAADPQFDPAMFLEGARSAYRMILEAYWAGDEDALGRLVDADVRDAFLEAIADRREAGHVLDNRLVSIERAMIDAVRVDGQTASIVVRFDADIAAVTRDAEGVVIAGSVSDAVATHDVWTFARTIRASDPNWILIETDEAA